MTDCLTLIWENSELILSRSPLQGEWTTPSPQSLLQKERLLRPSRAERAQLAATREALTDALVSLLADRPRDLPIWVLIPPAWVYRFSVICPDFPSPEEAFEHIVWETIQRINGEITPHRILVPSLTPGSDCEVITARGAYIDLIAEAAAAANVELSGVGVTPLPGEDYIFDASYDLRRAEPLSEESESSYTAIGAFRFPVFAVVLIVLAILSFGAYLLVKTPSEKLSDTVTAPVADTAVFAETLPVDSIAKAVGDMVVTPTDAAAAQSSTVAPAPTQAAMTPPVSSSAMASNPFSQIWQLLPSGSKVEFAVISPAEIRLEVSGLGQPREWLRQAVMLESLANLKVEGEFTGFDGPRIALLRLSSPGFPESLGAFEASRWNSIAGQAGLTVGKGTKPIAFGDNNAALKMIEELWKNSAGGKKIYLYRENGRCVLTAG